MVSGIRMLEQAPARYCQQLSRKGDMEATCASGSARGPSMLWDRGLQASERTASLRPARSLSVSGFPDSCFATT
ncbi:hypothetical protein CBM2637_B130142 [Cupriavidus taiwanensis]|nr:hypothetical protein CBM2637_B130142 [Cupriavidus taiwanensis]